MSKQSILVIPDTHIPAEHPDALDFLCAVKRSYRTNMTLHVGDVVDWHAISYHESDPDLPSSGDELSLVQQRMQQWGKAFRDVVVSAGNHDKLPQRKLTSLGLPKAFLRHYNDILGTPKSWLWMPRYHEFRLRCGMPVVMQHSLSSSIEAGKNKLRTASLVSGHYHSTAGTAWNTAPDWRLFYLAVGCLVDPTHPAMAYADEGVLKLPALGCGLIVDGYATHIPMWLNEDGRWNGKVP